MAANDKPRNARKRIRVEDLPEPGEVVTVQEPEAVRGGAIRGGVITYTASSPIPSVTATINP